MNTLRAQPWLSSGLCALLALLGACSGGDDSAATTTGSGGAQSLPVAGGAGGAMNAAGASASGGSGGGIASGGAGGATQPADAGKPTASPDAGISARDASTSDSGSGGRSGSSDAGPTDCTVPPAPSALVGWATQMGDTTGGGSQTAVVVHDAQELTSNLSGSDPRVIHVSGSITGSFKIGSNKTVIGICGAEIRGHLGIGGESNVVLRNLKLVGNNCSDSPSDCSAGADALTINGGSDHVWVDHLDISDGSDGNLDITQGSDFVTVSWTKFSYSSKRSDPAAGASGHRFSNLIGASDTDPADPTHLNITYHHCWWAQNVDQRMPRTRRGQIHVFNNLFTASGNSYCTNAGQDAQLLVQNNVYSGVNTPLQVTANGNLKAEGNDFTGSTGNQMASGSGFTPPYPFKLDPTAGLQAAIESGAGPH